MRKFLAFMGTPLTFKQYLAYCVVTFPIYVVIAYFTHTMHAATVSASYLPIVTNNQPPVVTRLVTLVDTDAGFVTVVVIPNTTRVLVAYTDRRDGNRLKIGEHIGDGIRPLEDPATQSLARELFGDVLAPSFEYPGEKQGFGMIAIVGNQMRIYATSRDDGDPTGWFKVKVLITNIPPAPQG